MQKFTKNVLKGVKSNFGRFLAIMAIVALGVGFLIGIMQATPDMKNTMSRYYIDNAAYDVDVKGIYGLSREDVRAIEAAEEVEAAVPVLSSDAMLLRGEAKLAARIVELPSVEDAPLNKLTLLEGRWPSSEIKDGVAEVVAVSSTNKIEKMELGTRLDFYLQDGEIDSTYGDIYAAEKFEVVGVVSSPDYYFIDSREVTSLGTGVLSAVLFAPKNTVYEDISVKPESIIELSKGANIFKLLNYELEESQTIAYTDCWVKLKGSDGYDRFTDSYKNFLEEVGSLEELAAASNARIDAKIADLKGDPFLSAALKDLNLSSAQWLFLDRASTNPSYVSFEMNVEKVEEIAGIFPVFFIVVAALVALTSMTRMVEEDRMQIGTFKALGYGNGRIMSKYLIYSSGATLIGCIVGILFGFSLLPSIFWQAYGSQYVLPPLIFGFSPWLAIAVFGIALAGTSLVTYFTCRTSLKEKPSALMQPKAPKAGKRILLERVGFLWNPMKFKWKATIRNIFRYKKNMLLTIVSVMGCTALILTGFGLNDSVLAASDLQYGKVVLYDSVVEYEGELPETGALRDFIGAESGEGEKYTSLYSESGRLVFNGGGENVELYLVEDASEFNSFVSLHKRGNSAIIDITKTDKSGYDLPAGAQAAVVVPENVASVYGVKKGDIIRYRSGNGKTAELVVYGVCENYTGTGTYMSRESYERLFGSVNDNTLFVKSGVAEADVDAVTGTLFGDRCVTSVDFVCTTLDMFEGLEGTMGLIIAVLVICAGGLAAIVLYNLTNINIEERRREIATLRVLGYRKREVAGYIYRESAILTIVGSAFGLLLGFLLHMFIVSRVSSVAMMFGKNIAGLSFLWAFLLTAAFAAIVYAFMLIKLYRIDMAESLKSNE